MISTRLHTEYIPGTYLEAVDFVRRNTVVQHCSPFAVDGKRVGLVLKQQQQMLDMATQDSPV